MSDIWLRAERLLRAVEDWIDADGAPEPPAYVRREMEAVRKMLDERAR